MKRFWIGSLCTVAAFAMGGALVGLLIVETGAYNPAATSPHMPITVWALHTTMIHAVKRQSTGLVQPPVADGQVLAGMRQYDQDCAACHGAPAVDRAAWVKGMTPTPPYLLGAARDWTPANLYWIIAHGVKMTGMPAWSPSRSPEQIWSVVAFLQAMPTLPPRQYLAMRAQLGQGPASQPAVLRDDPPVKSSR